MLLQLNKKQVFKYLTHVMTNINIASKRPTATSDLSLDKKPTLTINIVKDVHEPLNKKP